MENEGIEMWKEICFRINKHKNSSEREFQQTVEFIFEKLGWSSYKGEIISQKTIPIGSAQRLIPDIILKNNDKEIIVIELKKNSISNSGRTQQQLFSYMLQLKLKFGVFIGENLQFYYDKPNDNEQPIKIFETEFIENNENAINFISLIRKPFDENKLSDFCEKRILKIEVDKKLEKLKNEIHEGIFDNDIKNSFIDLLKNKYDKQVIEKISDDIEVKISLKNEPVPYIDTPSPITSEDFQLEFIPSDERVFKQKLIETKKAKRTWYYKDKNPETDIWDASKFTTEANLRGNIFSNNKVRARKDTGLIKVKFEI